MNMLAKQRKCRTDASIEGRMFHDKWTFKFEVMEHRIYNTVVTMRFYNINLHFESNYNKITIKLSVMKENEKLELIQRQVKQHKLQTKSFEKIF